MKFEKSNPLTKMFSIELRMQSTGPFKNVLNFCKLYIHGIFQFGKYIVAHMKFRRPQAYYVMN